MHRVFTSRRYAADMTFRQPLRAVPFKPGNRYRSRTVRRKRNQVATYLGGAALLGAVLGTASIATAPGGFNTLASTAKPIAVSLGLMRARAPQEGDYWPGCNAARAAGTAPIYIGEPGYREGMDGDGDGVACEPYRGM